MTIVARDYGRVGRIVETLPTGLSSLGSQTVTLRLLEPGPQTVSYTVTASETAAGRYPISGVLEDETKEETLVGTSIVTVVVPVGFQGEGPSWYLDYWTQASIIPVGDTHRDESRPD